MVLLIQLYLLTLHTFISINTNYICPNAKSKYLKSVSSTIDSDINVKTVDIIIVWRRNQMSKRTRLPYDIGNISGKIKI
jgi:hypothetical protein